MGADIIVLVIIAIIVVLCLRKIINDKKNGIGACGYKCSDCPSHGGCSNCGGGSCGKHK